MNWSELDAKLKARLIRDNPEAFTPSGALRPVGNPQREPNQRGKIEDWKLAGRPESLGFRVTIISLRRKLVDGHDNLRTGAKPGIDLIAAWLGFKSDDDPRLEWCYCQLKFTGTPGTIVQIDPIIYETRKHTRILDGDNQGT